MGVSQSPSFLALTWGLWGFRIILTETLTCKCSCPLTCTENAGEHCSHTRKSAARQSEKGCFHTQTTFSSVLEKWKYILEIPVSGASGKICLPFQVTPVAYTHRCYCWSYFYLHLEQIYFLQLCLKEWLVRWVHLKVASRSQVVKHWHFAQAKLSLCLTPWLR